MRTTCIATHQSASLPAHTLDDVPRCIVVEEQRVVSARFQNHHLAYAEACRLDPRNDRILRRNNRGVRDAAEMGAIAHALEERALRTQVGADEQLRNVDAAERACQRDRLSDARVPAHFLNVPARHHTPQRVTNDEDARADRNALDELSELSRDASNPGSGCVRERGDAHSRLAFEACPQWTKHPGACEEAVYEHHDVFTGPRIGNDGCEVAWHQCHLANECKPLSADELFEGNGESHPSIVHESTIHARGPKIRRRLPRVSRSGTFRLEVVVGNEDIDMLGHASNIAFVRWIQDAAVAHSASVGLDLSTYRRLGAVFVVVRHEIDYLRPALRGDVIEARTWISSVMAAKCMRSTELVRRSDGELLAKGMTAWGFVELASGRPKRIVEEVRSAFEPYVAS